MNSIKWTISKRPRTLNEVYGNDVAISTIKNYFKTKKIPESFILLGQSGTGKTTISKIIAKSIVCTNPNEDGSPCCQCEECKAVEEETYNKSVFRINGSNEGTSVDAFKEGSEYWEFKNSVWGGKRVIMVEEFQGLSSNAKESLLLDLENPNSEIYYILTTTGVTGVKDKKIFDTVASRSPLFQFEPMNPGKIMLYIKDFCEKNKIWDSIENKTEVIKYIAESSNGNFRKAIQDLQTVYEAKAFKQEEYQALVTGGASDEIKIWEIVGDIITGKPTQKVFDYISSIENDKVYNDARMIEKILSDIKCFTIFHKTPSNNYYANQTAATLKSYSTKVDEMIADLNLISRYDSSKFDMILYITKHLDVSFSQKVDVSSSSPKEPPKRRTLAD